MNAFFRLQPLAALRQRPVMGSSPRAAARLALAGLAAPHDTDSEPGADGQVLRFLRGAFTRSLDDVRHGRRTIAVLWDHQFGNQGEGVLGASDRGDLRLWQSPQGLQYSYVGQMPAIEGRLQVSVGVGLRLSDSYVETVAGVQRRAFRSAHLLELSFSKTPRFPSTTADEHHGVIFPGSAIRHPPLVEPMQPLDDDAGELIAIDPGGRLFQTSGLSIVRPGPKLSFHENKLPKCS
jgi:hypothetical protein